MCLKGNIAEESCVQYYLNGKHFIKVHLQTIYNHISILLKIIAMSFLVMELLPNS